MNPVEKYYVGDDVVKTFKAKMIEDENGCWVWQGSMNQGITPSVSYKNKRYSPKTCMYVTAFPDEFSDWHGKAKLTIKNSCDNKRCCNPNHLYVLGSKKYNAVVKGSFLYNFDEVEMYHEKYIVDENMIDYIKGRVTVNDNDCWIWPNKGGVNHATIKYLGKQYSVALVLYVTLNKDDFALWNPDVANLQTDSICGDRNCVNPNHVIVRGTEKGFWSNVNIGNDNECWEWKTSRYTGRGYAMYAINGYNKEIGSHRLAYQFHYKEEIRSQVLAHTCDNKRCCNPNHLVQQSHQKNIQNTHTRGLHQGIDGNTAISIKLTILDTDLSQSQIADKFDVHINVVSNICSGKTWVHLDILPDGRSFLSEYRKKYILGYNDYMTIYVLQNNQTNRVYIGVTGTSLYQRLKAHKAQLRAGTHTTKMQLDYDKYGWDSLELIDEIQISDCNWKDAEIALIHKYRDASYELYNTEHVGGESE